MTKRGNKKPIYVIIGTRAQLIKTAPVMKEMEERMIPFTFIYTAQHKETIYGIINNFGIKKPDIDLGEGDEAKTVGLFGKWIFRMLKILMFDRNKIVPISGLLLTHGDTATCVWGAILGKLTGCKVIHLESGLRSFNLLKPFPEEIIRLITFRLTDIYMCPSEWAVNNLKSYMGIKINTRMNTQYDSVMLVLKNLKNIKVNLPKGKYCVVSIHRFENIFDKQKFNKIIGILEKVSKSMLMIFVLHPATVKQIDNLGYRRKLELNKNIILNKRLPFFEFIKMVYKSEYVITDGGSNQEELYYLGKPTLILRDVTERTEGIGKNAILTKFDDDVINDFVSHYSRYKTKEVKVENKPSKIIVDWIEDNI